MGRGFFVSPSDSVAVIAANAAECVPYLKGGLKGVARPHTDTFHPHSPSSLPFTPPMWRSMPTSGALDRVAQVPPSPSRLHTFFGLES